jgi:hypothetical protein
METIMRNAHEITISKLLAGCAAITLLLSGWSLGAIADAAGKTGDFQVKLKERCALSSVAEITKRTTIKGFDYDLSKETFSVYVPKEAGPDGKYGLIVALPTLPKTKPPAAWEPVLDKMHLIWIAAENYNDGRDVIQHM